MKQQQPTEKNTIRVALFPEMAEKSKFWVAQCLDIDLVAQGETAESAQQSFRRVLQGHICLAIHNHRSPFSTGAKP